MSSVPQQPRYDFSSVSRTPVMNPARPVMINNYFKFNGLVWYLIFAFLIGLLLFVFRPAMVTSVNQTTGDTQLDWGKLIIWSVILALIVLALLWVTRGIHGLLVE